MFERERKIVCVWHDDSKVWLDIDRIIAMSVERRCVYFESVKWHLSDADFAAVWNKWVGHVSTV